MTEQQRAVETGTAAGGATLARGEAGVRGAFEVGRVRAHPQRYSPPPPPPSTQHIKKKKRVLGMEGGRERGVYGTEAAAKAAAAQSSMAGRSRQMSGMGGGTTKCARVPYKWILTVQRIHSRQQGERGTAM